MKISIITATWNSSATLRYTMRSVLSQSYPNIEHIIVDGGSTDSTMEIVHELEPEYQGKLRYISGKDKGIYDAMNKGIAMATGDYGAQNETYIEGWEKKTSNLLIYKRLCNV